MNFKCQQVMEENNAKMEEDEVYLHLMLDFQYFATFFSTTQVCSLFSSHSSSPKSSPKSPWKIPIFFVFLPTKSPSVQNRRSPPDSLSFFLSILVFLPPLFPLSFLALFSDATLKFQPPSFVLLCSCLRKSSLVAQSNPFSVPSGRPKQPTHQSSLAALTAHPRDG